MAEREIERWITVNGVHIPVYKGESSDDAVSRVKGNINKANGAEKANKQANRYKFGMSRQERKEWLENAPVGTEIKGLVDKDTGFEYRVRKEEGYTAIYGGLGAGSRIKEIYWTIGGNRNNYMARTLREAEEGTSKYYKFKKG